MSTFSFININILHSADSVFIFASIFLIINKKLSIMDHDNLVFYRVFLHDSSSIVTLNVPEHFLLNVIQMALASDVRVSIPNFAGDVEKSISK